MSFRGLFNQLCRYQQLAQQQLQFDGIDHRVQYHPDLSPLGWHLGHCVYTETYWIREKLLGVETIPTDISSLYNPFISEKTLRGDALPELPELLSWANEMQTINVGQLNAARNQYTTHELMQNNFLLHFLVQHYAQHLETMRMIITQFSLTKVNVPVSEPVELIKQPLRTITLTSGQYTVGQCEQHLPYDNEYAAHEITLEQVNLAVEPVSNGDFYVFMESGGYLNPELWSEAGWQWVKTNNIKAPSNWYRNSNNSWYVMQQLDNQVSTSAQPVSGVSMYEASAYASWCGGRLLHEHEWEVAAILGLLDNTGVVWEWCMNTLYPYPDFRAWPYDGYSVPYFDNQHYVLKGGSQFTEPVIKRPSFRNYYLPDKRFLLAGIRIALDQTDCASLA